MAHILLIADRMLRRERTGIDAYYDALVHWLPRLAPDTEFTLLSFGEPNAPVPNLRHVGLSTSRRALFLRSIMLGGNASLRPYVQRADLVHLLMPLPLTSDKPLLTTIHDLAPYAVPQTFTWRQRALFRYTLRHLVNHSSRFITASNHTADDLRRVFRVPPHVVDTVYLGVSDAFYVAPAAAQVQAVRETYRLPDQYFLFTGSMHPRKNLPGLLEAYRRFSEYDQTGTQLVIAGRMGLGGDVLLRLIRRCDLEHAICLPGYVDSADLPIIIGEAVAVLYPSLYEGFGLPALEAMACGTPVIASRAGALPETTGGYAVLCDPLDTAELAASMRRVLVDDTLRMSLVREGRVWSKRFRWQATAEQTLHVYNGMLEGKLT
ncbi:MAG: glycosyltransferase family 4 protein [Anaerolineae bacterium]|nr:glycosyltransferase family 4 protein [Anaerolineae bacterium]